MSARFKSFRWSDLLSGTPVYAFEEFYVAKDVLLRYDHRTAYLNYGLWDRGPTTPNPSASLVAELVGRLALGPGDALLDLGSGLGQPAADAALSTPVGRVLGINRNPAQVALANERAAAVGVADRVAHRVHDAHDLHALPPGSFTACVAVESLAEMPDLDRVLGGLAATLAPGARFALCDVVRLPAASWWARALSPALLLATRVLYGDAWRTPDDLRDALAPWFDEVEITKVGGRVYPDTWRYARGRLDALRARSGRAVTAGLLASWNLRGLATLYALGVVDYAIVTARRR